MDRFGEIATICGGLLTIANLIVIIYRLLKKINDKRKASVEQDNAIMKKMEEMETELKRLNKKFDEVNEQLEQQKLYDEMIKKCLQNIFRSQARELYYVCIARGNKIKAKELTDLTEAYDIYGEGLDGNHYFDDMYAVMKGFKVIED